MSTWATTADVLDITGVTVTEAQLTRAQHVIDMVSGRTYDIHDLLVAENRRRDLYWLKLAVAYQAAWMIAQPDMFTRMNVTRVDQDMSEAEMGASALVLAPLARRALNRLSWRGTRSLQVQRPRTDGPRVLPAGSPVRDEDWEEPLWRPL
ncbi:hypothetical protein [Streptomyces sp. NPDC056291]|uniref:hypothetical protein n=1 Tax=Streptomyces sp. NPDC056291 TaxID=3345772 RepID=UPI0035D8135D